MAMNQTQRDYFVDRVKEKCKDRISSIRALHATSIQNIADEKYKHQNNASYIEAIRDYNAIGSELTALASGWDKLPDTVQAVIKDGAAASISSLIQYGEIDEHIFISTNNVTVDNDYYKPILLRVPSIKESLDLPYENSPINIPPEIYKEICKELKTESIKFMGIT